MRKTSQFATKYLDKLIEEATTDAYNESEQAGGFFAMIEENLALLSLKKDETLQRYHIALGVSALSQLAVATPESPASEATPAVS